MSKTAVRQGFESRTSLKDSIKAFRKTLKEEVKEEEVESARDDKVAEKKPDREQEEDIFEKVACLEKMTVSLKEENGELWKKIGELTEEVNDFKNRLAISEAYIVKVANTPK